MKLAIGFFGITRSLKYTIESINKNIFDVFKSNNIEYDIFIHSYLLSSYKNNRTGEQIDDISKIDNEEYKLLNPKYMKQDNQDEIKKILNLSSYRTHRDPWNTKYNSVDNFILGSYSKYILTNMIEEHIEEYDYILFMRPDCIYLDKFNIEYFKLVNYNSIVIPNFHLYGSYRINDRFAITNPKTYKIYGEVFTKLLEMSKKQCLHSETIIGRILSIYNKLNIHRVKINFSRVRCDGQIVDKFKNSKCFKALGYLPTDTHMEEKVYLSAAIICKNEEDVIQRCLKLILPHVDEIKICDTGSTDNTIKLIEELGESKITLYTDYQWNKNFAEARNHVNKKCTGEWILSVDCDSIFKTTINIKSHLKQLSSDITVVKVFNDWGSCQFYFPKLYRNLPDIYYKYNYHNILVWPPNTKILVTQDISFNEKRSSKSNIGRTDRQKDLIEYFDRMNLEDPANTRGWFYSAQTHFDNKNYEVAIEKYQKRVDLGGWAEEVYYSLYKIGLCKLVRGQSMDLVIDAFLKAHSFRPTRLEALYQIVRYCRTTNQKARGFKCGILGFEACITGRPPNDFLFLEIPLYQYKFADELSVCAYWAGQYHLSLILNKAILANNEMLPDKDKERIDKNLEFSLKKCK